MTALHLRGRTAGFTLIELMVVVVIIGILAAIAIPRFNMSAHRSKEKEADMVLKQVYQMQETYVAEHGAPAGSATELAQVGFEEPANFNHYVWTGSVTIPLCLPSTGSHNGRRILETGEIENC